MKKSILIIFQLAFAFSLFCQSPTLINNSEQNYYFNQQIEDELVDTENNNTLFLNNCNCPAPDNCSPCPEKWIIQWIIKIRNAIYTAEKKLDDGTSVVNSTNSRRIINRYTEPLVEGKHHCTIALLDVQRFESAIQRGIRCEVPQARVVTSADGLIENTKKIIRDINSDTDIPDELKRILKGAEDDLVKLNHDIIGKCKTE